MSSDGTNIRVVISAESNKKLQAIQARLMGRGLPAGKREAIEYSIALAVNWREPEPKQRKRG